MALKERTGIERLVGRYGATPVVATASLAFLLPLSAWAGTVDLVPSAGTWIAGGLGLVLVVPWLLFARRVYAIQAMGPPRPRRFEWDQMARSERLWLLGCFAAATGVIGWLNAAATVDLGALLPGLRSGKPPIVALVVGAAILLVLFGAATAYCWGRAGGAYRRRLS